MTKPDDPAYWMLQQGLKDKDVIFHPDGKLANSAFNAECYICNDPEYALMGLPLCTHCVKCGAHVPADDVVCDNGHNQRE